MVASSNARSGSPNRRPGFFFQSSGRIPESGFTRMTPSPRDHQIFAAMRLSPSWLLPDLGKRRSFSDSVSNSSGRSPGLLSNRSPANGMLSTPNPEYTTYHTTMDLFQLLSNTRLPTLRIKSRILRGKMLLRNIKTRS